MSSLVWEKLGKVSRRIFLAKYLFHGGWRSEWGRGCSRSIERDERGRGGGVGQRARRTPRARVTDLRGRGVRLRACELRGGKVSSC